MSAFGWFQFAVYLLVLIGLAKPLGGFMAKVYQGERTFLTPILGPLENLIYRLSGVDADDEMDWKTYAVAVLVFSFVGMVLVILLQRLQGLLPLNPQKIGPVASDLAFNTSASFITNTNWQSYGGETTMSYLTQMLALTVQNFVSAAYGMASPGSFDPRHCTPYSQYDRQLLGRLDPGNAVHPAALWRCCYLSCLSRRELCRLSTNTRPSNCSNPLRMPMDKS